MAGKAEFGRKSRGVGSTDDESTRLEGDDFGGDFSDIMELMRWTCRYSCVIFLDAYQ